MGIVNVCKHDRYLYGDCRDCENEKKGLHSLDEYGFKN